MTSEHPTTISTQAQTAASLAVTRAALLQAGVMLVRAGNDSDAPSPAPASEEERLQVRAMANLLIANATGAFASKTTGGAA